MQSHGAMLILVVFHNPNSKIFEFLEVSMNDTKKSYPTPAVGFGNKKEGNQYAKRI